MRPDDGVLLAYSTGSSVALRQELVHIRGSASLGVLDASAEVRTVRKTPLLGGGAVEENVEWGVSGGPAAQVPILGGVSVGATYSSGRDKVDPSIKGSLLGGSVSLRPGSLKAGYVPDVGSGARIGLDWDFGEAQYILTSYVSISNCRLTSYGYLTETGLDKFGEYYAPGAVLRDRYYERGTWSGKPGQGWISGVDILRFRIGPGWWNLPYEEVP